MPNPFFPSLNFGNLFGGGGGGGGFGGGGGLLGPALMTAGALSPAEQGYVRQGRQFLRNQFTSPNALSQNLAGNIGGIMQNYEPFLKQQQTNVLNDVQQRFISGQPQSFSPAMSGDEARSMRDTVANYLVPQRQALMSDIGMNMMGMQNQAANEVMNSGRPNTLAEGLGTLGAMMTYGDMIRGGGGGGFGQGQGYGQGQGQGGGLLGGINNLFGGGGGGGGIIGSLTNRGAGTAGAGGLFGGGQGTGMSTLGGLLGQTAPGSGDLLIQGGLPPGIAQALQTGITSALPGATGGLEPMIVQGVAQPGMYYATDSAGNALGIFNSQTGALTNMASGATTPVGGGGGGLFGNLFGGGGGGTGFFAPQAAGTTGLAGLTSGEGLMGAPGFGTMGGLMSGAGAGFAGYGLGNYIGGNLTSSSELGSTAGGAGAGALAGFLIGGPIGAVIGSLAGAFGGFSGSQNAQLQQKAVRLSADMQASGQSTASVGSFWTEALGASGYQNIDGFANFVQQQGANDAKGPGSYSFGGVSGNADQADAIAHVGGQLLLKQIQQNSPQIQSLDQIPGFRDGYINHLLNNTFIEQGGKVVGTQDIGQKGSLLLQAGLQGPSGEMPGAPPGAVRYGQSGTGKMGWMDKYDNLIQTSAPAPPAFAAMSGAGTPNRALPGAPPGAARWGMSGSGQMGWLDPYDQLLATGPRPPWWMV